MKKGQNAQFLSGLKDVVLKCQEWDANMAQTCWFSVFYEEIQGIQLVQCIIDVNLRI